MSMGQIENGPPPTPMVRKRRADASDVLRLADSLQPGQWFRVGGSWDERRRARKVIEVHRCQRAGRCCCYASDNEMIVYCGDLPKRQERPVVIESGPRPETAVEYRLRLSGCTPPTIFKGIEHSIAAMPPGSWCWVPDGVRPNTASVACHRLKKYHGIVVRCLTSASGRKFIVREPDPTQPDNNGAPHA